MALEICKESDFREDHAKTSTTLGEYEWKDIIYVSECYFVQCGLFLCILSTHVPVVCRDLHRLSSIRIYPPS